MAAEDWLAMDMLWDDDFDVCTKVSHKTADEAVEAAKRCLRERPELGRLSVYFCRRGCRAWHLTRAFDLNPARRVSLRDLREESK